MVRRLNNAIHKVRPDAGIPRFGNYKCEMVHNIPKQRPGSNDCTFYAKWYMEYYNADHGTVVFPYACSHFYTIFYELIHGTRDRLLTFPAPNTPYALFKIFLVTYLDAFTAAAYHV
jgi:hypothetical protein